MRRILAGLTPMAAPSSLWKSAVQIGAWKVATDRARQRDQLKSWIAETLPRTTRHVGAWIEQEFGIVYQSRSGLVTLLHRLGMEHRKPQAVSQKLDVVKQKAFIEAYETLMNTLPTDEAVMFADAVHPTHAVRPVGCWAPKETKVAVDQTSGRKRMNIHGKDLARKCNHLGLDRLPVART